jgi:hypothetical protein
VECETKEGEKVEERRSKKQMRRKRSVQTQQYSRGQKKVGQCFFANVNLLALSMVTMKIFIYLL